MRRIAIALTLIALVAGLHACAADAPTKPPSGGGGGQSSTALQITLFTNNANPKAGTCTLIEALVSLNGNPVPDGSSVVFSADFGTFSQNGLPSVSVVTSSSAAVTALCGPGAGASKVRATATVAGKTGSATLTIVFQPDSGTLPVVSFCSPSLGGKQGGDSITLNGLRFFGTTGTTRVQFTVNGITRDGIVTAVNANSVIVTTPAFPELTAASSPAAVTLTLGTNLPTPVVLSLPACFTFGSVDSGTPSIAALLPSSGTNDGNVRVTIIGSGFATNGVQVFFGGVEAIVVSTTFNQIIVLSPPAFGAGAGNRDQVVDVVVKNIASGVTSIPAQFRYTPAILITSINNERQRIDIPNGAPGTFTSVTIFGQGFLAPVAVTLAGIPAIVQSVSATEVVVVPAFPPGLLSCSDISGNVTVTNVNSGAQASGATFTYAIAETAPRITSVVPSRGAVGTVVTIDGTQFPLPVNAEVTFGTKRAAIVSATRTEIIAIAPDDAIDVGPTCGAGQAEGTPAPVLTVDVSVHDLATGCSDTSTGAFIYMLPCVIPPTPTPAPTVTPTP